MSQLTRNLRRQVRQTPLWATVTGLIVAVAAGMFFLGRYTQNNSYRSTYNHEHALVVQKQRSLDAKQAALDQRSSLIDRQSASLASAQSSLVQQQQQLTSQQASLAQQQSTLNAGRAALAKQQASLAAAQNSLHQQQAALTTAKARLASQEGTLAKQVATVNAQKATLASQEATLAKQVTTLQQQVNGVKATQFSDGLFQVGRDVKPGKYHTQGAAPGSQCHWALLRSSNPSAVVAENRTQGPQTVMISSPYFESSGCGVWTKSA